jgi:hypothetical protein
MRLTDNRYAAEMAKFQLAVRMIAHEARTGTIRHCTGFSEDRIRKIYATYFKSQGGNQVRRRRGKTPRQIACFVGSAVTQSEATVLACLFLHTGLIRMHPADGMARPVSMEALRLGERLCEAFETYQSVHPRAVLCIEKAWALYTALALDHELYFAQCALCASPYVQDRYALDYQRCPFCEHKHGDA